MTSIPEKPSLDGLEARWMQRWEADGTYRFDRTASRDEVFAIDTPPPTASGSLHIGHGFSYTHPATDCEWLAAHRARVQLHPHRHDRPLPPHARQRGVLPDRLGRQRPGNR